MDKKTVMDTFKSLAEKNMSHAGYALLCNAGLDYDENNRTITVEIDDGAETAVTTMKRCLQRSELPYKISDVFDTCIKIKIWSRRYGHEITIF